MIEKMMMMTGHTSYHDNVGGDNGDFYDGKRL